VENEDSEIDELVHTRYPGFQSPKILRQTGENKKGKGLFSKGLGSSAVRSLKGG
jgi:hypothetical protein